MVKDGGTDTEPLKDLVGTAEYVAPEVINGSYDLKCDVWSVGCLTHMLLAGEPPFRSEVEEYLFAKIKEGKVLFDLTCWKTISDEA
jgi:calcium-dependent protein kinase